MNFRDTRKEDPEINLIPLIDVLLVIIIFLMLTTTYSKFAELNIQLPTAQADKQLERPNEINVVVTADGQYQVNRRPVVFKDVPSLAEELRRAGADMKDPTVIIYGDNRVPYQAVVRIMDASRQAGYGQVAFSVEQPPH
jgi:biopolymer transport protein ExbD